jgi:hypothetical protein
MEPREETPAKRFVCFSITFVHSNQYFKMDVTNLYSQSQVFLTLSILAVTIFFFVFGVFAYRHSSQTERPLRYHVKRPKAVESAHRATLLETSTSDVRPHTSRFGTSLISYSPKMVVYIHGVPQTAVPSAPQ